MSSRTLFRLSGLALILGSALSTIGFLLWQLFGDVSGGITGPLHQPADLLMLIGSVVLLIGLPGLYARQATQAGRLGLIAFVMLFLGVANHEISIAPIEIFIRPLLAARPETQALVARPDTLESLLGPLYWAYALPGMLIYFLGIVLFGIATLRARVFPRWAAILLIVGPFAVFAPLVQDAALGAIALGWVWCGYSLMRGSEMAHPVGAPRIEPTLRVP